MAAMLGRATGVGLGRGPSMGVWAAWLMWDVGGHTPQRLFAAVCVGGSLPHGHQEKELSPDRP